MRVFGAAADPGWPSRGGGHAGGEIVFAGTPADLVADGGTCTAQHLREYVAD